MTPTLTHLRTAIANLRRIEREHAQFEAKYPALSDRFDSNPYAEALGIADAVFNAALDALEGARGVEVKPLEWDAIGPNWRAETPFNASYTIMCPYRGSAHQVTPKEPNHD